VKDPYKYFRIEANELVCELAKGLLELEREATPDLVARLLRHAHTLKGAARIVKHRELADLAHAMEDTLAPLREAPIARRHDDALAIVDRMQAQLAALASPQPVEVRSEAPPLPLRSDAGEIDAALTGLAAVQALIGRSRAAADPRAAARHLEQAERELREIRRDIEQLRLSPAGSLFTPLERTARDAAIAVGKRVGFAGSGAGVRVDAPVLAVLHGALVQLVRNAVAHGIELPGERAARGKPADGRVAIAVATRGPRVAITCEDDGRGLDLEAIRGVARGRGVDTDDASRLFALLLEGGITTSPEVSELAGRGIGLDVVRDAVSSLGGEVSVRTTAGAGTAITLVVPVSMTGMAIVAAIAGGRAVAIPREAVRRVTRLRAGELVVTGDRVSLALDDTLIPYTDLAGLLGAPRAPGDVAIVVDGGDGMAAVSVDRVTGVDDAVVRAIPQPARIDPIVWGMALDAEGHPYPVVEPRALVAAARDARILAVAAPARPAPILVVDDSLTTRMLEQSILESAGFAVDLATSAEDALVKLGRDAYALVLVDVEMPGMDGFGLVTALRANPALANLPAILVTSRDAPEDRRRGAAVGAQGYMVKSRFDQIELLALIRKLVRA
jgi:two-component system chemotaxis sensor kinase CheA